MVARHAERLAGGDHTPHEIDGCHDAGAAVYQIAQEDGAPPRRMAQAGLRVVHIAEQGQQLAQLVVAAVDVANDVEGVGVGAAVGEERHALDAHRLYLLRRIEDDNLAEAFALEAAQPPAELLHMVAHHLWAELAVRAGGVALDAEALVHVEDDGDGQHVVLAGDVNERGAVLRLDIGGVHHGEAAQGEPQRGDVVQSVEGGGRDGLVVGVVTHDGAIGIRAEDFRGEEVARGEGALAGARGADEHDETERRDVYLPLKSSCRIHSSTSSPRALANPLSSPTIVKPHFCRTRSDARLSLAARAYRGRSGTCWRNCASAAVAMPLPQ